MNITYKNIEPLKEALLEAGRVVLIAIIPILIDSLNKWQIDFRTLAVVGGITLLRFIDKYLHIKGKVEDNDTLVGGLTRF